MEWSELVERQCGVVSRSQARALGLSDAALSWRLTRGRWRRVHPGVYVTHTGPVTDDVRLWAAVLAAGPRAVLSHGSAAAVWGLLAPPPVVRLIVPLGAHCPQLAGVRVQRSRRWADSRHKGRTLPCTRVEPTVLDVVGEMTRLEDALAIVADAVQRRLTTAVRLRRELEARGRQRWRGELMLTLDDVAAGAHSGLELAYLRRVERAHQLPPARRQATGLAAGKPVYRDAVYEDWELVVELDGRRGHADPRSAFRDMARDNASTLSGYATLRFGYAEVLSRPCAVAAQVAQALTARGWTGRAERCAGSCGLPPG